MSEYGMSEKEIFKEKKYIKKNEAKKDKYRQKFTSFSIDELKELKKHYQNKVDDYAIEERRYRINEVSLRAGIFFSPISVVLIVATALTGSLAFGISAGVFTLGNSGFFGAIAYRKLKNKKNLLKLQAICEEYEYKIEHQFDDKLKHQTYEKGELTEKQLEEVRGGASSLTTNNKISSVKKLNQNKTQNTEEKQK